MHSRDASRSLDDRFSTLSLSDLGWARTCRSLPSAELELVTQTTVPALVVRVDRGGVTRVCAGDGALSTAQSPPHLGTRVGDWVLLDTSTGRVTARCTRRSVLQRRDEFASTEPKVFAANIDVAVIVEALDPGRSVNIGRIRRFSAAARQGGSDVTVVLTHADVVPAEFLARERDVVADDFEVLVTGSGDEHDIDALTHRIGDERLTAVLVGASGAGKSTLVNGLIGDDAIAVGTRRSSGTGRHTTRTSRLVPLPAGGFVVDTPGVRLIGLAADAQSDAPRRDSRIDTLARECRFTDCSHEAEPGCAVLQAVESGELNPGELDTYRALERELAYERSRVDAQFRREQRRTHKQLTVAARRARSGRRTSSD